MTGPVHDRLVEMLLRWDRIAMERKEPDKRKMIWRVMDALDGAPLAKEAAVWLDFIDQTDAVKAIREALGIDDVPMWARRAG